MAGVEAVNVPPERKVINIVSGQIVVNSLTMGEAVRDSSRTLSVYRQVLGTRVILTWVVDFNQGHSRTVWFLLYLPSTLDSEITTRMFKKSVNDRTLAALEPWSLVCPYQPD